MPDNLPWYKSKVIVGAMISMIAKLAVVSGLVNEVSPEDSETLTNTVVLVISGVGDLMAFFARITQKAAPPIALTKGS